MQRLLEGLNIIEYAKHSEGGSELAISDRDVFEVQKLNFAKCRLETREGGNFADEDYGIHFPLKKDTPVLIAFENGDIDCPIALGALPKETCKSPVAKKNSHQNILKTSSGIKFLLDDSAESLEIEAPTNITIKAGGSLILEGKTVKIN